MQKTNPAPPHGALGERREQKKHASQPISAISGTVVIPSLKLNVHVTVPKTQHPHKAHNQDKR
jgi:hypothetical protein